MATHSTRKISDNFIKDLKCGILKDVLKIAKSDDHILCIREGYINIYYRGHSLFRVEPLTNSSSYTLYFNLNHARFTEKFYTVASFFKKFPFCTVTQTITCNKEDANNFIIDNDLNPTLFNATSYDFNSSWYEWRSFPNSSQKIKYNNKDKMKINTDLLLKITKDNYTEVADVLPEITSKLKTWMDDFLTAKERLAPIDYFTGKKPNFRSLIEKERQQEIILANNNLLGKYFIYDMEFAQSRNSGSESNHGRFDMLALRCEDGIPKAIVFIELKSTVSACKQNSGVSKHFKDLEKYINGALVHHRLEELNTTLRAFNQLNIISDFHSIDPQKLEKEILFIFTDDATEYTGELDGKYRLNLESSFKLL